MTDVKSTSTTFLITLSALVAAHPRTALSIIAVLALLAGLFGSIAL